MFRTLLISVLMAVHAQAGRIDDYYQWHEQCLAAKDAAVIDQYIVRYQKRLDADPKDQLARVYLGSAYTLRSAETFWGPKKLEFLKQGGALMDEAVTADPGNPRVRFIRAVNAYKVPKRFKRRDIAVKDFLILLPVAKKGGQGLSDSDRQAMLFYAWKTFSEEGEAANAKQARQECHRIDKASWYGQQAGP